MCEDVGIVLAHDTQLTKDKDMDLDILPAKSSELPAQVSVLFKLARIRFMSIQVRCVGDLTKALPTGAIHLWDLCGDQHPALSLEGL